MSSVLLLSMPNGKKQMVRCPAESDPEEIAKGHGTTIYEYYESEAQAKLSLERDPTRRVDWV